jgi:antitoxin component YwqK of YwqJK toxin-antitoxin module
MGSNKRVSYYFPEYKFYFTPDSCTEEKILTISGYRYLKIHMLKNCKEVEVSCYRSKDKTLIEMGIYTNTDTLEMKKAIYRDLDTKQEVVTTNEHYKLRRIGVWKFYDNGGKVIKQLNYE